MVADAESQLADLVDFDALPSPMFKFSADPRVTRVGRHLRRWSVDELPQLINVFRGEMSLVGPRPEQIDLVERYGPEARVRLELKPGITGPMQVFGRGELSFDERLAVERAYIEDLSLRRDMHLLLLTISAVVRGDGAF
jgi:lipopolysaccharide/colanic/teichoic acid biosynthesis glycosyltransferase